MVGTRDYVAVDIVIEPLAGGDRILLCTDARPDAAQERIFNTYRSVSPTPAFS